MRNYCRKWKGKEENWKRKARGNYDTQKELN